MVCYLANGKASPSADPALLMVQAHRRVMDGDALPRLREEDGPLLGGAPAERDGAEVVTVPTWTLRDVMAHCRVTEGTVRRWVRERKIPCWHERGRGGMQSRFDPDRVRRWWSSESKLVREVKR